MSLPEAGVPAVESPAEYGDELLGHAGTLEQLVRQLLVGEQSVFTREVARYGLTVPQFVTLAAIEEFPNGKERMGRIAEAAHQCSATMTGIIDRLALMGLVERQYNREDRRSVLVELTDSGRTKIGEVRAARTQRLARLLSSVDPDMRTRMFEMLSGYVDALSNHG
jgi:DNA-binding MarR family transcriptional regulator